MSLFSLITLIIFASAAGTITGFGTSTIMMPIVLIFYPLSEAIVFITIIHWFNAIWRLLHFRRGFNKRLILTFGISGIITAIIGAKIVFIADEQLLTQIVAIFLILYSIFLFKNPHFELSFNKRTGIIGGAISGLVSGLSGMGGAIRCAFLAAYNLPKEIYLANSALLLAVIDTSRLATYFYEVQGIGSLLGLGYVGASICVLSSFIGVDLGKRIVDKIPQEKFRIGIALFLFAIAIKLLWV